MKKVFKQALSILLVAIMIVTVIPLAGLQLKASAGTNEHTQAEAIQWLNDRVGIQIGDGQCPALAQAYYAYLGYSVSGNGKDYEYNVPSGWQRTYYYSGYVPQAGDIAVWRATNTTLGKVYGHVAIVESASSGSMTCFEQGNSAGNKVRKNAYSYGSVTCFIRPDFKDGPGPLPKPDRTDPPSLIQRFSYNGRVYEAYASTYTWWQSKSWCENNGGHLATITQPSDQCAINLFVNKYDNLNLFLGAECETTGSWRWIDGTPLSYTYWGAGQPDGNGGTEKFLGTYTNGTWNDFNNSGSGAIWGFILEKDAQDKRNTVSSNLPGVKYSGYKKNGDGFSEFKDAATMGTAGESMFSSLGFELYNCSGGISYSVHLSNSGWTDYVSNGAQAGTTGQDTAIEAIKIKLTGDAANKYKIYYRTFVNGKGWYSWTSDNQISGTTGAGLHVSAVQALLVPKVKYSAHVAGIGWTNEVSDGATAGTTGQNKQCEAMYAKLADDSFGDIKYSAHIANVGWGINEEIYNGRWAGSTSLELQMEAMKVSLTGEAAKRFDVFYRAHIENDGWSGYVTNGTIAGTTGQDKQLEAFEIKVRPKGSSMTDNVPGYNSYADGELGVKALRFNTNGGTEISSLLPCANSEFILPSTVPVKEGYNFAGWYKKSDFSSTRYMPNDVIKMDADYTLYAKWETAHVHSYTSEITKPATCAEEGIRTYTCDCGHSYTEPIQKLEHNYTSSVTTEATCVNEGLMTYTCSGCGDKYTESIPATGEHIHSLVETHYPTCTEDGKYVFKCQMCDDSYEEVIPATGHHYDTSEIITEPTCTDEGLIKYTCACGDSFTEPIFAAGHDFESTFVEPTCTERGYSHYVCINCGFSYDDDYVDTIGHTYTSAVTKEATCTEAGVITYTCSCGDSYTESIPAEEHDFESLIVEPTCTERGYTQHICKGCGCSYNDNYVDIIGHTYTSAVTKEPTCTEEGIMTYICSCGDSYTEPIPKTEHEYSTSAVITEPTCTEPGILQYFCSCGDSYTEEIPAKGHDFSEWIVTKEPSENEAGIKERICIDCGHKETEESNIIWTYSEETKTLTVYAYGDIPAYSADNVPWKSVEAEAETIKIYAAAPEEYSKIGANAFGGCINAKEIFTYNDVWLLSSTSFPANNEGLTVYGCYGLIHQKSQEYHMNFVPIFGDERNGQFHWFYDIDTKTITLSGTGEMPDYNRESEPWRVWCNDIEYIEFLPGLTSVGAWSFRMYYGNVKSITLPDTIESIGERAFYDCTGLTSVIIPDSVTSIGDWAFYYCSSLTSITIPDSVTSIGDGAFDYCESLTSITIPDSVTSIGNFAFGYCSSLTSITIPDSVTSIGDYAFCYCRSLTSITIPDSVTSIGSQAFSYCSSLTSITIPDSVTSIGNGAFRWCEALTSITVDKDNKVYDSRNNCNAIIVTETNTLIYGCKNTIIPDSVTSIGDSAFERCSGLTSITIPDSVTSIGDSAFERCSGLTSIIIPESVTSIGESVFDYGYYNVTIICYENSYAHQYAVENEINFSLIGESTSGDFDYRIEDGNAIITGYHGVHTKVSIPSVIDSYPVTNIGDYAFEECTGLTSITIPDSVTSIGECAFFDCTGLTSVTIPDSVASIGHQAFAGCENLTSVTIPDSVESIDCYAFAGCESLTSITIPNSVTSIRYGVFKHCTGLTSISVDAENPVYDSRDNCNAIIKTDINELIQGCNNSIIPDSVTSIGDYAFNDCMDLTSITIPDSVTSIGDYAFYHCMDLTSITIPDSVTSIGYQAFAWCESLTSITIPNSVTSIGDFAFFDCTGLTSITIPDSVTSIGDSAFNYCKGLTSITIPDSVTKIGNHAFAECEDVIIYCYKDSYAHEYATENEINFVLLDSISVNSNTLTINNGTKLISGFANGTADISSIIISAGYSISYDKNVNRVYSGMPINVVDKNNNILIAYTAVVFGDVNGDGFYDGMDAMIVSCLANGLLTQSDVSEAQYMAADCNHDGVIDSADVALLEQAGLILASVDQSKSPEELVTDSAYVEYLNLIDQNPTEETPVEEATDVTPTDEPVDEGFNKSFVERLIDFIIYIVNLMKSFIAKF